MLKAIFITQSEELITSWLSTSLMSRAENKKIIKNSIVSLLDFVSDHHQLDDAPYGGGPGELLKVNIMVEAIEKAIALGSEARDQTRVLLMDPAGKPFTQNDAVRLKNFKTLIFASSRYEGVDARVYAHIDEALSLGDFILSNGDLAALCMWDAIARMIPGFLGNDLSAFDESLIDDRLESSRYTRPPIFRDQEVPKVFREGNHQEILKARIIESIRRTMKVRPDLIEKKPLDEREKNLLKASKNEIYPWQAVFK